MKTDYFFDSYAVIELLKESPAYASFQEEKMTITKFNLAEIYWHFLLSDENMAEEIFEKIKNSAVEVPDEVIKQAMQLRKKYKKQNLSYADCIGYTFAQRNNLVFLTGDKEFEKLPNVEFVK